ncbi:YesL family protein [Pseudarthrobacter sp. NS4]|uniref:YesL family protein n=1 Tax=Pseudarthrobacter sp. NS4 TaxID=2973976 RepID=UPI002161CD13|nr:YesL family protein [Pseudarthrobacter sp. NS4]
MNDAPLGWAGRLMEWLRFATSLVLVNVLFIAGSLAGLVLLGIFPAAVAATTVLARLRAGETAHVVRDFVAVYRSRFRHANLVGSIFWLAGLLLGLNLLAAMVPSGTGASPVSAVLLLLSVLAGAATLLAAAAAVTLCGRYRDSVLNTWKAAFLLPLVSPGMSVSLLGVLAALAVIFAAAPILLPLVGAAVPLLACGALVSRRAARLWDQLPAGTRPVTA